MLKKYCFQLLFGDVGDSTSFGLCTVHNSKKLPVK